MAIRPSAVVLRQLSQETVGGAAPYGSVLFPITSFSDAVPCSPQMLAAEKTGEYL